MRPAHGLGSIVVRTVKIVATEGLQLTADEWGNPSGPPVLMCHGAGQNRHAWKNTADALASSGWFVTTVDARGHGDSDWSTDARYDSEDIGRDIVALLQRFDRPPAIVGASMGGMASLAAQRTAASQLYNAVILVDITPHFNLEGARRIISFMSGNPDGFTDLDEAAETLGTQEEIAYIHTMLKKGTSADRQLALYKKTGDLKKVVQMLSKETLEHC